MINFTICNAFIIKSTRFLPTIYTVHMTRVSIYPASILELNETIGEFSINNCIDPVNFDGAHYFKAIEIGVPMYKFGMPERNFHFKRIDSERTGCLSLSNLEIHETIHFGPHIAKLEFYDVTVSEMNYIIINENFKTIQIIACKGHFIIPGIFSDRESHAIYIADYICYLKITKTKKGSFDIFLDSFKFDKLVIEMNINTAEFNQVTIAESLLINSQRCKNLVLNSFMGRLFIPNIASFNELKLFNLQKLYMSYKVAFPIEQASAMQNTPMSGDQNINVLDSSTKIHIPIIKNNHFENIFVSKCSFPINIANVLRNVITNVCLFPVVSESEFYLTNHNSKKLSKLKLVNNRVCGIWQLESDVRFLSLVGITSDEDSKL
ncbi:putative LRR containing protein [Trachipleistophora hominis]|uniref:Putative LRR containing protein n=1 Tax=Trachipleistophora hominis TaxID=72359 RepID=L7JTA1_TRAHO|nr:putative LRR containing protein [Trachipleistophora hominis]